PVPSTAPRLSSHAVSSLPCYNGHHSSPQPFPTRRSSDLSRSGPAMYWYGWIATSLLSAAAVSLVALPLTRHQADRSGAQEAGGEDRKSTRLNSSHVESSYAVFCWKKKKLSGGRCTPTSGM